MEDPSPRNLEEKKKKKIGLDVIKEDPSSCVCMGLAHSLSKAP